MSSVWDYDEEKLQKSKRGRLLLLERKINYGVYLKDKDRIDLKEVKENWDKINIEPKRRRLFEFFIWGK